MAGKKTRDELIDILNLVVDKVTSNLNIDEILLYGYELFNLLREMS